MICPDRSIRQTSFRSLRTRLKPAFLVLGTQKAGTSALFEMLRLHPRILAPKVKEPHFFNREDEFAKGMAYYFKQFPLVPLRGPEPITFEASAGYLYNPLAPERIKKHLPDAELFAVLRDPVQRAFSAWNMFRQFENTPFFPDYHDPRTFEQAVEDEISGKPMHVAHRYLDRGVYAPQLGATSSFSVAMRASSPIRVQVRTPRGSGRYLCHHGPGAFAAAGGAFPHPFERASI
ncbi:MAG: sulfotransferase domain-containing protein [Flavobacteriales bacterium]|nr:sulfotransferase domain-containing protein [Flavobacteriales bacterium]